MRCFAHALLLAILTWAASNSAQGAYWKEAIGNTICSDGIACARANQIAAYGTKIVFGACFYLRADRGGYLYGAKCLGWLNTSSWFIRYGYATLYCEANEVKTKDGCIKAAIPDKDPSCDTQTGNPVDASSGMKLEYALDFTTAGSVPLKFERHYRSNTNTMDGKFKMSRLGTGWRSSFDSSAYYWPTTSHPSSSIRFLLPDGTNYAFKESSNLFVQRYYSWSSKAWKSATVNRYAKAAWVSSTQRYELTTPDDTVWSYDTDGRLRTITYRGGYSTAFTYDRADRLVTLTYPSGREFAFTRDPAGQVAALSTRADGTASWSPVWSDVQWQPFGPFSSAALSSGLLLDHAFNTDRELTRISLADGAALLMDRSFARTDLINITAVDNIGTANDQSFAYSPANRLSAASGEWGSDSYTYDAAGMPDGPNRFAYALDNPVMYVDENGQNAQLIKKILEKTIPKLKEAWKNTHFDGPNQKYMTSGEGRICQVRYKDFFVRLDYQETVPGSNDPHYHLNVGSSKKGKSQRHIPLNPSRW
jgi:YD repeat-containing protein